MVQANYSPEEALERVKLMMSYDMSKTLNENKVVIFEQSVNPDEYFTTVVKGYMKNPDKMTINYGNPTGDPKKNAAAFLKAIKGIGRQGDIDYVINQVFNNISNSMSLIKIYPETNGETLYDAIDGEWFSGDLMKTIVGKITSQLKTWCTKNPQKEICKVKSKEQMKYGI